MAKSRKKSIVAGMSTQDILNIDNEVFNKLNTSDLRAVVNRLSSTANKRLQSFEKAGVHTPATRGVERSGGKFSTAGKNLNQLRAEFVRAKNFLQAKSGTLSAWKSTQQSTISALRDMGIDITSEKFDKFWQAYERLKEVDASVSNKRMKYAVKYEISKIVDDDKNVDDIVNTIYSRLDEIYEQRTESNSGGVSGFFE